MSSCYILDENHNPVPADEASEAWYENYKANRRIGRTEINGCLVSTVFLGIDHSFSDGGAPILFETMVFPVGSGGSEHFGYELLCLRYTTWQEAHEGHNATVAEVSTWTDAEKKARR